MNIKEYIVQKYSVFLNNDEYNKLEKYLLSKINEINSVEDLKRVISNYILKYYNPTLKFGIDNSDLIQALMLLKEKAKNTK